MVIVAAGLLTACAPIRWSGHPLETRSATPERVSVSGHDQHGHGLPLHESGAGARPVGMTGAAAPLRVSALLYRQRAEQIRSEVAAHNEMKNLYAQDSEMAAHCDRVIAALVAVAVEYDAIAGLYETRGGVDVPPVPGEPKK